MSLLNSLRSPIIFAGSSTTAYRDPAAFWLNGEMHLFFTLVESTAPEGPWLTVAHARSADLIHWTAPQRLTPYDRSLNFSSPGNIVQDGDAYVLCLQTYCRENGEKYGNEGCRLFTMRSADLETWSQPELLRVKGEHTAPADMGRMIDPYLLRCRDGWRCFYKQCGMSVSRSEDLRHWQPIGHSRGGENFCVLPYKRGYMMFHSPRNGIGRLYSEDLLHWKRYGGKLYLGQRGWSWARGRLTAAFVLDGRSIPQLGQYVMFFHGSGPRDEDTYFDTHASIGIAWSSNLRDWHWPGQRPYQTPGI